MGWNSFHFVQQTPLAMQNQSLHTQSKSRQKTQQTKMTKILRRRVEVPEAVGVGLELGTLVVAVEGEVGVRKLVVEVEVRMLVAEEGEAGVRTQAEVEEPVQSKIPKTTWQHCSKSCIRSQSHMIRFARLLGTSFGIPIESRRGQVQGNKVEVERARE